MRIPLDRDGPLPLYRQIERFLREQITSGNIPSGTRLPATRQLAEQLGVSRMIVADAYDELQSQALIYGARGSGTFVAPVVPSSKGGFITPQDWPLWQQELLSHSWQPSYPEMSSMLAAATRPDTISFAEQTAPDESWPADDFRQALQAVLRRDGPAALGQGDDMGGYVPLRITVAEILSSQGIPTQPENVVITSGSQQALNLVAGLLLHRGDTVIVESPTYNVAIDLFRSRGVRLVGIPVDEEGMQVQRLEETLRFVQPRLIYTIPTFQNPSGACMSGSRRRALVTLASRHDIPILEDDFIGNLRYEGRAEPALKALDPGGRVIFVGTFSKVLMPGLRVGFLVTQGPVLARLLLAKYVSDLATSEVIQRALTEYITVGRFQTHLRRIVKKNRLRRDAMLQALRAQLPPETVWLHPAGGRFAWVQLPFGLSANELFPLAADEGVTFVPGSHFFPGERPQSYMRLNFALNPPEVNEEGVRRLARALNRLVQTAEKKSAASERARNRGATLAGLGRPGR